MQRAAPLKRSGFARKAPVRAEAKQLGDGYTIRPRSVAVAVAGPAMASAPVPKQAPVRHEGYRRLVAAMPCAACKAEHISQAAHPNTGKGLAMKADDRLCFPLCADQPGRTGCHARLDQGGHWTKEARREFEAEQGAATRAEIHRRGLWPADLAVWPGDE